jgi:hypothetical protein
MVKKIFYLKKIVHDMIPMDILAPHLGRLVLAQDLKTKSKLNELKGLVSKSPTIKQLG